MRVIDKLEKIGKENVILCLKDLDVEDKKIDRN